MGVQEQNLYYPVMYLMKQFMKRHTNSTGDLIAKDYIEPVKLHRDERGRLQDVEGWEYLDTHLTFNDRGVLEIVDTIHRHTGKHLRITLTYTPQLLLDEVIPEIIDPGIGEPGQIDIPDVISDFQPSDET